MADPTPPPDVMALVLAYGDASRAWGAAGDGLLSGPGAVEAYSAAMDAALAAQGSLSDAVAALTERAALAEVRLRDLGWSS